MEPDEPVGEQPVERLAQMIGPPLPPPQIQAWQRSHGVRTGRGDARAADRRRLVDLLRLAPVLSRCPLCERVSARRPGAGRWIRRAGRGQDRGLPGAPDACAEHGAEFKRRRADEGEAATRPPDICRQPVSRCRELERRHREKWPRCSSADRSPSQATRCCPEPGVGLARHPFCECKRCVVGEAELEPAISCPPDRAPTRLGHSPKRCHERQKPLSPCAGNVDFAGISPFHALVG